MFMIYSECKMKKCLAAKNILRGRERKCLGRGVGKDRGMEEKINFVLYGGGTELLVHSISCL